MKKITTLLLLFCSIFSFGQFSSNKDMKNFEKRRGIHEDFYANHKKGKGTGYKVYKRWEDFIQKHLDTNNMIINNTAMSFNAFSKMKKRGELNNTRSNGYWVELGPDEWTNNPDPYPSSSQGGWNPGNGRINEIAIDPNNPLIIYAGASGGGLWKSSNGGSNWTILTDGMPNIAVSGIVVSYTNSNIVYLLSGDFDSKDLVSIGVLKSLDGGSTWSQTGLVFDRDEVVYGSELKMNYNNSNELIATTSEGIYFTDDNAETWNMVQEGNFSDIVYHPTNPDTVYASTDNAIFRSANGGQNWIRIVNLSALPSTDSRIELAVTIANTDKVYAVLGDWDEYLGTFISEDRGTNWIRHFDAAGPNILASDTSGNNTSTQAPYDLCIEVSPFDEDEIIIGGINIWKSTNGADDWVRKTYWRQDKADEEYVHADIHELVYHGTKLYAGSDGGFSRSLDYGESWTDLSEGLVIMQPHKIGITNTNTNLVYLGTQDNGVNRYSGTSNFDNVRGADGFECIILPTNSDTIFTSRQNGIIERSVDGGNSFSVIIWSTNNKLFNNPLLIRPGSYNRLIVSRASEIIITSLSGSTIDTKTIPGNLSFVSNIDISPNDDDLLVASLYGRTDLGTNDALWITTSLFEAENTWFNITGDLPVTRFCISDVVIDPSDDNHIIVSFNGYSDEDKVFESWDRGNTWHNNSYNLENVPVNCIAVDPDVPNSVYVGTDLGVFYKEPGEESWIYYANGLPPVMVHELEINSTDNLIYAATYGRGLWKSALYANCTSSYTLTPGNDPSNPDYTGIQHYEASSYIQSNRVIQGGFGTNVHYQAGEYIDLVPGFRVFEGNIFRSVIGECGEVVNMPAKEPNTEVYEQDIP